MAKWVKLTNVGSGFDAELLVERLRGAGLHAHSSGDTSMFGAGYMGPTPRGVDVFVLANELTAAREYLEDVNEPD